MRVELVQPLGGDQFWSSQGFTPKEALGHWRQWVADTLAPNEIEMPDESAFSAHWKSHALGPLHLLAFQASPQRVVHKGYDHSCSKEPAFQLVYSRQGTFFTRAGTSRCAVNPGEFVLLDNSQFYEMRIDATHEAIDLVMPASWLQRHLPDPFPYLGRSFSASCGWGLPFGSLLTTMAGGLSESAVPRGPLADQVGALLSLALGDLPAPRSRHRSRIAQRMRQIIEERHAEPELKPADVATELGISKRYLHALLAETGMTFMGLLNAIRLDRASEMLANPRFGQLQVAEIAWRCGYLDPSYFARLFGRRFNMRPVEWRAQRAS